MNILDELKAKGWKYTPDKTVVAEYKNLGFSDWFCPINAAAAREATCGNCNHQGLKFKGFSRNRTRVAISICPHCGDQEEF